MRARRNEVDELTGVLIHDGECPFCSAAATALRRLPGVGVVAWDDEAAQSFLAAQFGDPPFAVVFVDVADERVYVGRDAAVEVCERAGVPALARDLVDASYERVRNAIRTGAGAGGHREPDPVDATLALADPAREPLARLLETASPSSYVVTE